MEIAKASSWLPGPEYLQCISKHLQLHLVCLLLPSGSINSGVLEINKPLASIYTELEHSLGF
jgi:hypothetical protein